MNNKVTIENAKKLNVFFTRYEPKDRGNKKALSGKIKANSLADISWHIFRLSKTIEENRDHRNRPIINENMKVVT